MLESTSLGAVSLSFTDNQAEEKVNRGQELKSTAVFIIYVWADDGVFWV